MPPKSDASISAPVDIGDRGVPSLLKDSNGNYQVGNLDANGNIKTSPFNTSGSAVNPATEETLTQTQELIETLQELVSSLRFLSSVKQHINESLRATLLTGSTTAVTGTLTAVTTVGTITNFGTGIPAKEHADDMNNLIVTMANIVNVTV